MLFRSGEVAGIEPGLGQVEPAVNSDRGDVEPGGESIVQWNLGKNR